MWLIGWRCKCSNVLSWPILINRGLNHNLKEESIERLKRPKNSSMYFWVCLNKIKKITQNIKKYLKIIINYCIMQKYKKLVINFLVMMTLRVIPVPIPNTEVKPKCAENTCGLPCWKDRLLPDLYIFLVSSVGRALGC